jgi:hypothetical protein
MGSSTTVRSVVFFDIAEKRRADGDTVQRTPRADTPRAPAHEDGKGKFRQHNQRPTGE